MKIAQGQRLGQCLPFFIYSLFRINALLFYQIRGHAQICNFKGGRRAECRRMAGSGRPGLNFKLKRPRGRPIMMLQVPGSPV